MMMVSFGSVCSGIEAASVAWHPLGWRAAWLAEIEPFPCAVLAHHYPDVPNLGDMTALPQRILAGDVAAPDVFTGGTPCQAFSVAGKRESLADARGNLSLTFVEIANAVDHVRRADGREPSIIVWENVPGVLSTKDNAFGCFLGALAGSDCELFPAGAGRWTDAGVVLGPRRAVAWRILDAQYFGLAQRRRRVFVVASAREGFDPAAVLLEFDGVRRDSAPRREAREETAGGPGQGAASGVDFQNCAATGEVCGTLMGEAQAKGGEAGHGVFAPALARCVTAGEGSRQDWETCTMVAHTLRGEGFDASEDGTGRGTPLVPVHVRDVAATLGGRMRGQDDACADNLLPVAIGFAQNQRDEVRTMDVAGALAAEPGAKQQTYVAFSCKDHGADAGELAPTLRAMGHAGSHANAGGQVAVATGFIPKAPPNSRSMGEAEEQAPTVTTHQLGQGVQTGMAVRRLTPRECERLQGFPDDYTLIPWRTWQEAARKGASYEGLLAERGMTLRGPSLEACPDGPRYKALGNSWAVPCVRWIGARIDAALHSRINLEAAA